MQLLSYCCMKDVKLSSYYSVLKGVGKKSYQALGDQRNRLRDITHKRRECIIEFSEK